MRQDSLKDAGFSLLEILVALMVLAISYAALSQTISSSLSQARSGADLIQAAELAERLHMEIGANRSARFNGRDGLSGLEWVIEIQPIENAAAAGEADMYLSTIRIRKPDSPVDFFVLRPVLRSGSDPN